MSRAGSGGTRHLLADLPDLPEDLPIVSRGGGFRRLSAMIIAAGRAVFHALEFPSVRKGVRTLKDVPGHIFDEELRPDDLDQVFRPDSARQQAFLVVGHQAACPIGESAVHDIVIGVSFFYLFPGRR